jgi:hypothetical protein
MYLLDFKKPFEVAYEAFGVKIGEGLSQEMYPIIYFNEKLT